MKHNILISYADEDKDVAEALKSVLAKRFGETIWLRDFDLNAGDKIIDVISEVISEVKWFILIYSQYSQKSEWLNREADIAMWSAMERQGFELVIVKLDRSPFIPALVAIAGSKKKPLFDISRVENHIPEFMRIADYIDNNEPTIRAGDIFIDRGNDRDKLSLLLRHNKIVFIVGLAGIGKTAFVKHSASEVLGKNAIEIRITRGHSLDRLSREILQKTHSGQPLENVEIRILVRSALDALKANEKRIFLFLNYVENALSMSNEALPFLRDFLDAFAEFEVDTRIILATTRNPEIHPRVARVTDIYPLKGLETPYIQECIQRWVEDSPQSTKKLSTWALSDIATLASGHPLAARLIAMYIKGRGASTLLLASEKRRMELKLGSFLLESVDKDLLNDLHHLILQILSVIREPMTLEDLLVFSDINKKYKIEELQQARARLVELLLVEQDLELMSLNSFLTAYYQDQVDKFENRQDRFADDYGEYAYKKAVSLKKKWDTLRQEGAMEKMLSKTSNDVFRYALAADRLLRMTGKSNLVSKLPFRINGAIRDLVVYYYQHKRNYAQALKYAEEWLKSHPDDTEITLFQIRCYRNIEDRQSLDKAEEIISYLEGVNNNTALRQRLLRERAMISEKLGDFDRAELYYRQGINLSSYNPYPENYIGLAHLILRKLDRQNFSYQDEIKNAEDAVNLLETARDQSPNFDRFHLGTYIDALIRADRINIALPLLEDALKYSPDDERLNWRMAEVQKELGDLNQAEIYSKKALRFGARKASLTLANLEYSRGKSFSEKGQDGKAKEKFNAALKVLKGFTPEFGRDEEVRDGIATKIHREIGDWDTAKSIISKYPNSINPHTIHEICLIKIHDARIYAEDTQTTKAIEALDSIISQLENYGNSMPQYLERALEDAVELRNRLEEK